MTTSAHPNSSSIPHMPRVLNPTPISFAPPSTKAFVGAANSMPSVPVRETHNIKRSKSRKPKTNGESPAVSTDSRNGKKLESDKDSSPSVSSQYKRPDWLPEGWTIDIRTRVGGNTAGSKDKYYLHPVTGRRYRSRLEVLVALEEEKNSHIPGSSEAGPSNKKNNKKRKVDKQTTTNGKESKGLFEDGAINGKQSAQEPGEV